MKKVLFILHQKTSIPGDMGEKFFKRGYLIDIKKPPLGDELPTDLKKYNAIVIFGGPMSANDNNEFPVSPDIPYPDRVQSLAGIVKFDSLDLEELASNRRVVINILNKINFDG